MSSHLVDDVRLPDACGGHPALDFCNTRAGWGEATPKEYLTGPGVLALWAVDNDLTLAGPGAGDEAAEALALHRALALREALYACALGSGTARQWELVGAEAAAARAGGRLVPGAAGAPARWQLPAGPGPAATALAAVALAAEDLLTSPLAAVVAACPGEGCGWLFADPRRRRRWCSMAACGNRAKARRHAERRGAGPRAGDGTAPGAVDTERDGAHGSAPTGGL